MWRKSWATSSPASPESQPWLQFVYNRSVICVFCVFKSLIVGFCVLKFIVCGGLYGSGTEQCAATGATPHRVRLDPADRDCKGIGLPVRWFHTFSYAHTRWTASYITQYLTVHCKKNKRRHNSLNIILSAFKNSQPI